jgi:hypothetical protein
MPRVPTETFTVEWPRLRLRSAPDAIAGDYVASADGPVVFEVALPSGLRGEAAPAVTADGVPTAVTVEADVARFVLPGRAGRPVSWRID